MFVFSQNSGEQIFVRKTIYELEDDEELISDTTDLFVLNNDLDFKLTRMELKFFLE